MRRILTSTAPRIRTAALTSYAIDDFEDIDEQLQSYIIQLPTATHITLTVHLRTPSTTSNFVIRDSISESPANIAPAVALANSLGLRVSLLIILFIDEWGWGGYWTPTSPSIALANYYAAIRPWIQAAQSSNIEWIALADEWSELYFSYPTSTIVPAFASLFTAARADYSGPLSIHVNWCEEPACNPGIIALTDFVTISAYVPLTNSNTPTYADMRAALLGPNPNPIVRAQVTEYAAIWNDPTVVGYVSYLRRMSIEWNRDLLLHTGYKSTIGSAIAPGDDIPETTVDLVTQSRAWQAFLDAAQDIGPHLRGFSCWRWWPSPQSDPMGYTPQSKPAASIIDAHW